MVLAKVVTPSVVVPKVNALARVVRLQHGTREVNSH
jgi:hypothetical protein